MKDRESVVKDLSSYPSLENLQNKLNYFVPLMTHKYRGCIVVFSINKSVEPNKEQKVLTSGFNQGFTLNAHRQIFNGF